MCGRFFLLTDLSDIAEYFDIQEIACDYRTGTNIAPGQQVTAVVHEGKNRLVNFRWGLIPSWAKDPSIGSRMFNARAETVAEKPSFRNAFKKRRCLIVADGFYEWQKLEKVKKPFYFSLKSGRPFGFAGLYESWQSPDHRKIDSCTILTTDSNELITPIHDRMPVILLKERASIWIDPENQDKEKLLSLLKPFPAEEMKMEEVGMTLG
ncbi:MAG: putative SOS response-associated peptidase YedK [Syntrophus sp. PtaU1.Bin208]|nr:MAG: putative SOS response-associated peptidase YedK [Syntrophus sp. PtaU1.Bin208]